MDVTWGYQQPRQQEQLSEQEMLIASPFEVTLAPYRKVALAQPRWLASLPTRPGIYFIYVNGALWYVGKAENLRGRFLGRMKTFHDFRIRPEQYAPWLRSVEVGWYEISRIKVPKKPSIKVRRQGTNDDWRPVQAAQGLLRALELFFIRKNNEPPGNKTRECLRTEGVGGIRIIYSNGSVAAVSGSMFCR